MCYSRWLSAVLSVVGAWICAAAVARAGVTDLGVRITVATGNDPDVAIDSSGNLHLVYESGGYTYYKKMRYPSGATLTGPILVAGGGDPQIVLDSNDDPHVVVAYPASATYTRWMGSSFSTPVAAVNAAYKPRMAIDSQDRVYIVAQHKRTASNRDLLRVFKNGVALTGEFVVGGDNPGGIDCDSDDTVHFTWRDSPNLYYAQYKHGSGITVNGQFVKGAASDFAWISVDPRDETLHVVSTHANGTAIDFVHGTPGTPPVWGSYASYGQGSVQGEPDFTGPTCGVDAEGYTYAAYTGLGYAPYLLIINPHNALTIQNRQIDNTPAGLKYKNPNIGTRRDMTGAYVAWGSGTVYVRSIGDVDIRGTTPRVPDDRIAAVQDFDGDGTADIIWQLFSTNRISVRLLAWRGTNATKRGEVNINLGAGFLSNKWAMCAAGRVDSDTAADFVWQYEDGDVVHWFMNTNGTKKSQITTYDVPTIWQIKAAGDIDGDEVADLFWQLPTGQICAWLMNADGTKKRGIYMYGVPTIWEVCGAGDINSDGIVDLFWQLPTGQVCAWLLNTDGTRKAGVWIQNDALKWRLRGAGDINGDGVADLIWWHPGRSNLACWLLNVGGSKKQGFYITP